MTFQYLLFDLDGTLIDSHEAICRSLNDTLRHYGKPEMPHALAKKFIGTPLKQVMEKLGIPPEEGISIYRPFYFSYLERYQTLYEGIKEMLQSAKQKYQLAVITNKGINGTLLSLQHTQIDHHFDWIITETDVKNSKPHTEMFEKTLHFFSGKNPSITKDHCLMIGDSPVDSDFAANCGIPFAFASWGFYEEKDLNHKPDYYLYKPDDLFRILDCH